MVESQAIVSDDTDLSTGYELFILLMTLLSLGNFVLILLPLSPGTTTIVLVIGIFISVFLIGDVYLRMTRARSRRTYLFHEWGWLDLLGSMPVPGLSLFRLPRATKTTRMLQHRGLRQTAVGFGQSRSQGTLLLVVFLTFLVVEFGSIDVLRAERSAADANIVSASDALWWSYVTISTVGYGDQFPVTTRGRMIGIAMLTVGVFLFSVMTGFIIDYFLTPHRVRRREQEAQFTELHVELQAINRRLDALMSPRIAIGETTFDTNADTEVLP